MDSLQNLKSRIKGGKQSKEIQDSDIITMHEIMLAEYGWIPLEEFKKLPNPTFWNLIDCLRKRKEAESKHLDKAKKGRRR